MVNRFSCGRVLGVLFVTLALAVPGTAQAKAEEGGGPRPATLPRNYLGSQVTTSSVDQCGKPVTQRLGNWMCLDPAAKQAQAHRDRVAQGGTNGVRPLTGHCTAQGCWYVYSGVDSDFETTGIFGWGGTTLGQVDLYYEVKLNGAQSISKPVRFTPTTGVSSLVIEGERLYYSAAHPEGHPVSPSTYAHYGPTGAINAHDTAYWSPNGYKAYENTVRHGSVVHEWVWTMAEFPGNWFVYGKSVKFDKTASSYRFGSSDYLGRDPVGAGWHPA